MGLGLATSQYLAEQGANLTLVDYNSDALKATEEKILTNFSDTKILSTVADVSDMQQVKSYVDKAVETFGTIHAFYNNAGIEGKQALMAEYDVDVFKKVIDINLMGVYYGLRFILPIMQANHYGRIVNVGSVGGMRGIMNQTPYVASKHAVAGMTKTAALEYSKYNIMVNAIAPGAILTPMVAEAFRQVNPENPKLAEDQYAQSNPTKRLGLPKDVATTVAYLLSEECSYVSGQIIAIDGGESNTYGFV